MHGLVSDDAPIKSVESRLSLRNGLDFALPYSDDAPSKSGKFGFCPEVALDIAAYLLLPPNSTLVLGEAVVAAIFMAVPKAAVDENHSLVLRQNNVRLAGEILDLQTETKTTGEEIFPDYQFRLCILPLIAAIQRLRCSGVIVSAINQLLRDEIQPRFDVCNRDLWRN